MSDAGAQVSAGRVGKAHGLDGSFYVEHQSEPLEPGSEVVVAGRSARIERLAGTEQRPLVRISGVTDRNGAEALRGENILIAAGELAEGEYLSADLVGCEIAGLGRVRRIVPAPSCDLLEVGEAAVLVPFISDAVTRVDLDARVIEVDAGFLNIDLDAGLDATPDT